MTFAQARDIALPEKTAPLLIRAMDYLEGLSWYGRRASATQQLSWPRAGVYVDGYELQMERNADIYQRQRDMKDHLAGLEDLIAIRAFSVE